MENKMELLSKEYVVEHGVDFDEKLWFTSYSDEVLDNPEDEGGKPFTGLAYELYGNGNLAYYCYYKNGFLEGYYVKFHQNKNVKAIDYMVKGQTRGIGRIWYESGELKHEGEYKFGICLKYTEWDQQGNIINQKVAPTKGELELVSRISDWVDHE
ncbi:hypothetical protein A374_01454 [Fictibacillus macauensis ZFHKF-1]|uniref:MORN repeat-containing protein n=1 Tax=Fictibacillus macauensis ZFHKF-1 TaxID=1196324 RepID=I8UJZ3_9BACL|nr:hypothetical protein [Fictibacillus macauensis]EIT87205.1 hypothetical protein A374_01454 [Fictibacillus macauensis ZFHKF-1]